MLLSYLTPKLKIFSICPQLKFLFCILHSRQFREQLSLAAKVRQWEKTKMPFERRKRTRWPRVVAVRPDSRSYGGGLPPLTLDRGCG
jgi:hypothetical protein